VIYYWAIQLEQLVLLLMYSKNERDDLTSEQVRKLRSIIEAEYP
jgi:hypothetical protein